MAEREIKELIKKRGSFKGRLTAFSNYLSDLSPGLAASQVKELQLRISKLEKLYEQYDDVQQRLECLVDDMSTQLLERNEFESMYFMYLAKAQDILAQNSNNQDSLTVKSCENNNHKLVKLPIISLPKFSGSYENWLEFHDTFVSLIHTNDEIDEINKFHYLRASLEGSASVVIQSIAFSANNYKVAWQLLCERFNNKRLLTQNHVSALFGIEPITKESSFILRRVIDQVYKNLRSLETLGEPTKHWDTLLIHIVTNKLDTKTYREWEELKSGLDRDTLITLETFMNFMRNRADLVETLEVSRNVSKTQEHNSSKLKLKTFVSVQGSNSNSLTSQPSCPYCNGDHNLITCSKFLSLSSEKRLQLLPRYKVCFNCLQAGHYANRCKKQGCNICKRRHSTLVHVERNEHKRNTNNTYSQSRNDEVTNLEDKSSANLALSASVGVSSANKQINVLLSTALVKVYDKHNREHIARALLDTGSTSCLMTEQLSKQLNLSIVRVDKSILGINNVSSHIGKMCTVPIKDLSENYATNIHCFILPSITDKVPCRQVDLSKFNIPSDICLADPSFYTPSAVDLILGADIFWDILGSHKIRLGNGQPILCQSRLGWLVSGPVNSGCISDLSSSLIQCNFTKVDSFDNNLQNQLTRFWQLEEVCPKSTYSIEEQKCEEHFVKNTTRLADGRFCVRIPLKENPNTLGNSLKRAQNCFLSLERRLKSQKSLSKMYYDFMAEYKALGHMSESKGDKSNIISYYIPHHGVLRDSSSTTKLRVVFNASSPTTTGVSFNNIQMVGPTIQDDLLSLLLRFRQHKYVLTADVEKMYRQVVVHPSDRHLQRIIWRDDISGPLKTYELNTVTYGTSSAPYLAIRCLKQLGLECKDQKISEIITHDFYVDDLLTGGNKLDEVQEVRTKVTAVLAAAQLPLRKWKSNELQLMTEPRQSSTNLNIGATASSKTLGLGWHSDSDELHFPIGTLDHKGNTKRDILSVIAQIFDPLGLLSPCVIQMKMFLQRLWLHKLSWDDRLPNEVIDAWIIMRNSLSILNDIRVPRHVFGISCKCMELHIFTDASERAYGASVYMRSVTDDDEVIVRLLMAKSRVAPIKPMTIPRLELCGGLIGARIYEKVIDSLRLQIASTTFWTDSTIVLGWLKMVPNKLHTFVRNRVVEILEKTSTCNWRHVPTEHNPADFISRGVCTESIQSLDLWWQGPDFLRYDKAHWPLNPQAASLLPEIRSEVTFHAVVTEKNIIKFDRFSNLLRLKRSIAYMLRFIKVCRSKNAISGPLSKDELQIALQLIIRTSQNESFPEYQLLLRNQSLPKKSALVKFNIFLDEHKLMRVGGRLGNSEFSYDKKYPILIQSTHYFTQLLFIHEHKKLLHAGPQLLLASIRDRYWPIGGRNLAKNCFHQCLLCRRAKGQIVAPMMGNLPSSRVQAGGYPFESVGVDYAGPMLSVSRQGRGSRLVKVYIAIFVCFTTKAVHLELVGDLTSKTYLLALRRFMSRRGKPHHIYSDNGTAFVGGHNEISKFLKSNCNSLSESMANDDITFHFIPAYSPHFGGLWEAGVKSIKYHLKRVLGTCNLTYEEFNTVLIQIESILNSRPLTPLSSEIEDLNPLTPAHFLIGRPLNSSPAQGFQDHQNSNHLTRFHRIEQLRKHFWTRWSKEYISELQQRIKWRSNDNPIQRDTLVVLKEDNLPPLKWRLGRIVDVFPGSDGVVRVADIKTGNGIVRRAFSKICPLPVSCSSG